MLTKHLPLDAHAWLHPDGNGGGGGDGGDGGGGRGARPGGYGGGAAASIQTRTFCKPQASLVAASLIVELNRRVTDDDECEMVRSMSNLLSGYDWLFGCELHWLECATWPGKPVLEYLYAWSQTRLLSMRS